MSDIKFIFNHFNPLVDAVGVTTKEKYLDMEVKAKAWKQVVKDKFLPSNLKTNILEGERYKETLLKYLERNQHDVLILVQQNRNSIKKVFKKNKTSEIIDDVNIPVIVYTLSKS